MQGNQARAAAAYQQVQVTSRSPLELVVMLYDGALASVRQAREAVESRDLRAKREAVSKAMAIITELQSTLDMQAGGEIAQRLDALYAYVLSRLVDANLKADSSAFDEVTKLITVLRDAWAQIAAAPQAIAG